MVAARIAPPTATAIDDRGTDPGRSGFRPSGARGRARRRELEAIAEGVGRAALRRAETTCAASSICVPPPPGVRDAGS